MTCTSQKFAKKFASCLDQIFQVQLMALEQKSLELMETFGKGRYIKIQLHFGRYVAEKKCLLSKSW